MSENLFPVDPELQSNPLIHSYDVIVVEVAREKIFGVQSIFFGACFKNSRDKLRSQPYLRQMTSEFHEIWHADFLKDNSRNQGH